MQILSPPSFFFYFFVIIVSTAIFCRDDIEFFLSSHGWIQNIFLNILTPVGVKFKPITIRTSESDVVINSKYLVRKNEKTHTIYSGSAFLRSNSLYPLEFIIKFQIPTNPFSGSPLSLL